MDKQVMSEFQFDDYKVNYVRYDLNHLFKNQESIEVDFELNTEIGVAKENNEGNVTLVVKIFDRAKEENYPFSLEVSVTGLFSAKDEMEKEDFIKFLEMSGTATLFPFLRSIIADITRIANVDSLVLPLINIYNLRQENSDSSDIK
jgi:preprotein translocase subunit SecB